MKQKFRVWDNIQEGYLLHLDDLYLNGNGMLLEQQYEDGEEICPRPIGRCIVEFGTGVKDKNGEQWFFGDIVRLFYQERSATIFESMKEHKLDYIDFIVKEWTGSLGITLDTIQGDMSEDTFDNFQISGSCNLFCQYISEYTEVVGTIHEEI